jgi:hypothetical protein
MKKNIIIGALLLILGFVIGIICKPRRIERVVDIQRDTITKIDTHVIEKPVLKETRVVDTAYVAIEVHDTTTINDTLYMRLEFETKTYQGEDYLAKVSGYNPSLYYIETYPKTTSITEIQTKYKAFPNRLALGVEASYISTLSIPIYLEYGRMLHENVEVYARVMRDIRLDMTGASIGTRIQFGW